MPITQICNLSIKFSHLPKDCNVANSRFHYKKGTKTDPKYFRPISLLPIVSEIIEKAIHDQTMNYLTETTFSTDTSQGFARTTQQVLFFHIWRIKYWQVFILVFDRNDSHGSVKSFDTINHDILLKKTSAFSFSDRSINWFQSYLSSRSFQVNFQCKYSWIVKIDSGIPQGSILGPLLFLLYVYDIKQAVDCDFFICADDFCLVYQHKDVKKI